MDRINELVSEMKSEIQEIERELEIANNKEAFVYARSRNIRKSALNIRSSANNLRIAAQNQFNASNTEA